MVTYADLRNFLFHDDNFMTIFYDDILTIHKSRCSTKYVFLKILQNPQENTYAVVFF